jgi:hypothetical protein
MSTGIAFDGYYKDEFVALVAEGHPPRLAVRRLSMPFTWRTVKSHLETDHEFRFAVADALADATAEVEYALYKEAKGGNLGAQRLWLANRGDFVDERNTSGKATAQGAVTVTVSVDALREALHDPELRGEVISASSRLAPRGELAVGEDDDAGALGADSDGGGGG